MSRRIIKETAAVVCTPAFWGPILAIAIVVGTYSSCGSGDEFNLFQPIAEPLAMNGDKKAMTEEVRVLLDEGKYDDALELSEKLIEDDTLDSNEARMLYAASILGAVSLDVWSIITKILDTTNESASSSSSGGSEAGGFDAIMDAFGETFLGTGDERVRKVAALTDALQALADAPSSGDSRLNNTSCLLAGMLAVPTVIDAQDAVTATTAALAQIRTSATGDGSECPDIESLNDSLNVMADISLRFSEILSTVASCPFLDLSSTADLMNSVESSLSSLTENADKGCDSLPTCPAGVPDCQSLFPTCVQEVLKVGVGDSLAGDSRVDSCEIVLHCSSGGCFE